MNEYPAMNGFINRGIISRAINNPYPVPKKDSFNFFYSGAVGDNWFYYTVRNRMRGYQKTICSVYDLTTTCQYADWFIAKIEKRKNRKYLQERKFITWLEKKYGFNSWHRPSVGYVNHIFGEWSDGEFCPINLDEGAFPDRKSEQAICRYCGKETKINFIGERMPAGTELKDHWHNVKITYGWCQEPQCKAINKWYFSARRCDYIVPMVRPSRNTLSELSREQSSLLIMSRYLDFKAREKQIAIT